MHITVVSLLKQQHELYLLPRGQERFQAYINLTIGESKDDPDHPVLSMINPMGREHVEAAYCRLLALDAEAIASNVIADIQAQLDPFDGNYKLGIIMTDEQGGWSNRYFGEMTQRFGCNQLYKLGWISVAFWAADQFSVDHVRAEVLRSIYRVLYWQQYGVPQTLYEMLTQEGYAASWAGDRCQLTVDELAYTREVLEPFFASSDYPTLMACLFGDAAADSVGYPTLGLSPCAGFDLALHMYSLCE